MYREIALSDTHGYSVCTTGSVLPIIHYFDRYLIVTPYRYTRASNLRREQDNYCLKAAQGLWDSLGAFPSEVESEPLVDVLRGKAKV